MEIMRHDTTLTLRNNPPTRQRSKVNTSTPGPWDIDPMWTPDTPDIKPATCLECGRKFDLTDENDNNEWAYGHDCEVN